MNPRDAVDLARYMRAHFPQQPIDEFTADALAETLREKYDTLRLQAQRKTAATPRQAAEAEMWERAYARAEAREIGADR